MAVMRKDHRVIEDLGSIGIAREGLKVFLAHAKVFTLIQLALMVDLAILAVTIQYLFYRYLPQQGLESDFRALKKCINFPRMAGHVNADYGSVQYVLNMVLLWLANAASTMLFQAALSLSLSATLYSVGLHYAGQAFSFVDVLRAVTPRLWMRLALTNTYYNLIYWSILVMHTMSSLLLVQFPESWMGFGRSMFYGLAVVPMVCLQIILTVASAVSVLEEDYGWASVKKSLRLLKGKKKVAGLLFLLLFLVPAGVSLGFRYAVGQGYFLQGSLTILLIVITVYLGWATFTWQFQALCSGVQYASFKAYHAESLADSLYKKRTTKVEYEQIVVDGSEVALVEGQSKADNTV